MIDYHIHTTLSDGIDTHDDCLRMAAQYNMREIGFSDHICLNFPSWAVRADEFSLMRDTILKLKNNKELPFKVRFGIEMDYLEGKEDEIKQTIDNLQPDYVIGSVHFIDGWNFDTDPASYSQKNIDLLYKDYFDLLIKTAKSGLFDFIGHADVIKKFGYYPTFKLSNLYKEAAKAFKKADIAIELNTSGLAKPCNEFYPSEEFLKICKKENVPVTLGSDAHQATDIARNFSKANLMLKNLGYRQIAVFENRKRSFVTI